MLLRRLSDRYPALCGPPGSPHTNFAEFAVRLAAELDALRRHPCRIVPENFFPLDLLLAFAPERRRAVLSGRPERTDWDRVAAVRLAQLTAGVRFPLRHTEFDRETVRWTRRAASRAAGPVRFAREVLLGKGGDRGLLFRPVTLHGAELVRFLARGSTSEVWQTQWRGRNAVLKLPVAGAEARFRAELTFLRSLSRAPGMPEVLVMTDGPEPYCIMEFCRPAERAELAAHWAEWREDLASLHRYGILHGDIRRSNLGFRADGSPVLFDFSHARRPDAAELRRESGREMEKLRTLVLKGA